MSVNREPGRTTLASERPTSLLPRKSGRRRPARTFALILLIGIFAAVCVALPLFARRNALTAPVKRADVIISVAGFGVVESRDNLDVACGVPGSPTVLEVVPDGSLVRKGDLLVRLDGAELKRGIADQKRALAEAEAAAVQANKEAQAARRAIDAYREGTFVQEGLRYDRDILLAQKRFVAAQRSLLQTTMAHRRGFGARVHVEAQEFVVEAARSNLESARHKKEVLEEYTGPKTLEELESKSVAARARFEAGEVIVGREKVRLKRLEDELPQCEIRAPRDGMVVYAGGTTDPRQANQPAPQIYPGAKVRAHRTLLRLADLDRLQIKMAVPEKQVGRLRRGQRVYVEVLGQGRQGEIVSIGDRPRMTSVADVSFAHYDVGVAIEGIDDRWKPGMTAEVDVLIERKKNVLTVPVVCVIKHGGAPHVRVKTLIGSVLREVVLGITNDIVVEIVAGVAEGERVLLNPAAEAGR